MKEYFFPEKGLVRAHRPTQLSMAEVIEETLNAGGISLIQAPTGTGKTYGYGVPVALADKKVIISTAKKALQHQIVEKDLPAIMQRLPTPKTFTLLKGRANYVCRVRAEEFLEKSAVNHDPAEVSRFEEWLKTADAGDLEGQWPKFGGLVNVTECLRTACTVRASDCAYLKAKDKFKTASIRLVNHALLARDIQTRGRLFGEYDVLIVDEAHQLAKTVQDAFAFELSEYFPERLLKAHDGVFGLDKPEKLKPAFRRIFDILSDRPDGEIIPGDVALRRAVDDVDEILADTHGDVMEFLRPYLDTENIDDLTLDTDKMVSLTREDARELVRALHVTKFIDEATKTLAHTVGRDPEQERLDRLQHEQVIDAEKAKALQAEAEKWKPEVVTHLKRNTSANYTTTVIRTDPLSVGRELGTYLRTCKAAILTSATLAVGDDFAYIRKEFGLSDTDVKHAVSLPPVFDYKKQACVFIDDAMPKPEFSSDAARDKYYAAVAQSAHELLTASKGGAFVLVPSWTDLKAIAMKIDAFQPTEYNLMVQTSSPSHDVETFRRGMNNVLIGTKSLWEGVDIPGMALRLVIVTRLPFAPYKDPVIARRKNDLVEHLMEMGAKEYVAGMESFRQINVMPVALELAQAVGRLLRSETDRGVIAVLDSRMGFGPNAAKSYASILRSVFPCKATNTRELALEILKLNAAHAVKQAA